MSVDISVIIPVYNAAELLDRCLDSVFGQVGDYNIEVILVDDGSTDNSVELIKRRPEQNRIKLYQQENSGPSVARNKGIQEARGKYLAFLDADDYWLSEFFKTTINFLENHWECIAVSVAQRHKTLTGESISPGDWDILAPKDGLVIPDFLRFWARYKHICTGSILIRTDIAKSVGGMRSNLRSCEDLEFWVQLSFKGLLGYIPNILFVSDGVRVTKNIGWIEKMMPRWECTPTIDEWLSRIVASNPKISEEELQYIINPISMTLIYDKMLTSRWKEGRAEAIKYGFSFSSGLKADVIKFCSKTIFTWWLLKQVIRYIEFHRK